MSKKNIHQSWHKGHNQYALYEGGKISDLSDVPFEGIEIRKERPGRLGNNSAGKNGRVFQGHKSDREFKTGKK